MGFIRAIPDAVKSEVVGSGTSVYRSTKSCTFQLLPASFWPMNCMSSFFCCFTTLEDNQGMYRLKIYLPRVEPITPTSNTHHMCSPYLIWNNAMTVQAGGPKKGSKSTPRAARKTKKYSKLEN